MDGRNMTRPLKILMLSLLLSLLLTGTARAQGPEEKLKRGVVNILSGWVEIPKNIYDTTIEENIISGMTLGAIKGIGMTVVRTGCGVYETLTFAVPVPDNYQPILLPEYVIETTELVEVDVVGIEGAKTYKLE